MAEGWNPKVHRSNRLAKLTPEQEEEILSKLEERMQARMYKEIGKTVVGKFLWIVGVLAMGAYAYFKHNGWIK